MPQCYYLPGIGGSALGTSALSADDTWVNYSAIARGLIGRMRIGADGVSPGPPDGVALTPGPPLPDYYMASLVRLQADLANSGYGVRPHPYDWRLSARVLGPRLAARIRTEVAPAIPCSIVAHSFGGLVARLAWADLARTGDSGLVRRIVTLGTPHWGSYGVPRLWSLDSPQLLQVYRLSLASLALTAASPLLFPLRVWPPSRLAALSSTWPALYETLPSALGGNADDDPHRAAVYGTTWPTERGVSTALLADALHAWQPLLTSAATTPPPWVMTTVAGQGMPTADRLLYPQLLGEARAIGQIDAGDGQVLTECAHLAGAAQVTVTGAHADLPALVTLSGQLAQLVLDPRLPPDPVPPPVHVPGPLNFVLDGPPSTRYIEGATIVPPGDKQYDP